MPRAQGTIPLDIPAVRVLGTEITAKGAVESLKAETVCQRCGKLIRKFHGQDGWVSLRYLPVFGRPADLRYRPKR
jgi:hypothetical protein